MSSRECDISCRPRPILETESLDGGHVKRKKVFITQRGLREKRKKGGRRTREGRSIRPGGGIRRGGGSIDMLTCFWCFTHFRITGLTELLLTENNDKTGVNIYSEKLADRNILERLYFLKWGSCNFSHLGVIYSTK